jgi:hypothetical protein
VSKKPRKLLRYLALTFVLATVIFAVGVALPLEGLPRPAGETRPIVIDDISIVDLQGGATRPGQTIIITGQRIVYAGASAAAPVPNNARHLAGKGLFAMPGLWDMHVHTIDLSPQLHFPLLIANGVTSVRDMGDGCAFVGELACKPVWPTWQQQSAAGTLLAPRLVSRASYHVEDDEDDEEGLVGALKARGDPMLKLQLEGDVDPAIFFKLVQQGRQAGMQVAGHLPYSVNLLDPQFVTMNSIEHDHSLMPQCATPDASYDGSVRANTALLQRADEQRCKAVLALMAQRDIAYVPSHVASSGQDWQLLSGDYLHDARVAYAAWPQRLLWRAYAGIHVAGSGAEERDAIQQWYQASLRLTARARASGVVVMAGSDSIDAYVSHGFGLHDELAQLVTAGLPPLQALQATTVPAGYAGMTADFGSVEAGKVADIVLLRANPLDNIANTRAIDSVIYNGQLHGRSDLDAMLAFVERQASSFSLNCKFLWAMLRPW